MEYQIKKTKLDFVHGKFFAMRMPPRSGFYIHSDGVWRYSTEHEGKFLGWYQTLDAVLLALKKANEKVYLKHLVEVIK